MYFYAVLAIAGLFVGQRLLSLLLGRDKQAEFLEKLDKCAVPSGLFPWTRGIVSSWMSTPANIRKGYAQFTKGRNLPFALPTMWTGKAVVVMPPSQMHIVNKPEDQISGFWALPENLKLRYFISDKQVMNDTHFEVSRKDLTQKHVQRQAEPSADEIDFVFRDIWGTDAEWKTVKAWDVCGDVIARTALRTLVGYPMCRNEALRNETRSFANALFIAGTLINCMPPFVRPVLGPVLALKAKHHRNKCLKFLVPFVEERIRLWRKSQEKGSEGIEQPSDFLQWLIPRCASHGEEHLSPNAIAMQFMMLNVMFVYATGHVFSHTVMDLMGSPDKDEIFQGLEEECQRVTAAYPGGLTNKEALDQLHRLDSTLRESMRISDAFVYSLFRDVVGDKPVDIGGRVPAPPGTRLVFPSQSIHLDPDNFKNPLEFDPFRFSRDFEPKEGHAPDETQRERLTDLTTKWLSFGHGKRACPGRWFVSQTLKQALGYMVSNYDVELVGKPPKKQSILHMMVPPDYVQMRLRRKPGTT